ncbi:MAG: GAF domain-containing protein [Syntrophobacteraceae bacterium]
MKPPALKVLLVEDDEDDFILIRELLSEANHWAIELDWTSTYSEALRKMNDGGYDACLLDYRLGARDGLDLLREATALDAPVIFLTGQGDYRVDMEAMKAGAADYLVKDQASGPLLERSIRYAIERKRSRDALRRAHDALEAKVRERTAELTAANQRLTREIEERIRAERALQETHDELEIRVRERTVQLANTIDLLNAEVEERKRIGDELRESRNFVQSIVDTTPDLVYIYDLAEQRNIYASEQGARFLGYTAEALLQTGGDFFSALVHSEDSGRTAEHLKRLSEAMDDEIVLENSYRMRHADGTWRWLLSRDTVFRRDAGDRPQQILGTAIDVTHQKLAEDSLRRANRALKTLNACNGALVHETNEADLLHRVCGVFVEVGGYRMAWVGFAETGPEKRVRPAARAGHEAGYLQTADIRWDDSKRGRGPTGIAVRTGQTFVARDLATHPGYDPWRKAALQRGFASSIALPMKNRSRVIGALTIYSAEPEAFDEEEVRLLGNLADNLSYGIIAIRTRIERERAENALRQSESRLRFLSSQLLKTQEEERKRLARELHDSIGSSLSAIKFTLQNALSRFDRGLSGVPLLKDSVDMTQQAIEESRRMMTDLRPAILDDLGIITTIHWFCRQSRNVYSNLVIEEEIAVQEEDIPEQLKITIFRVIQEAMHNAAKYSGARVVNLSLVKKDNSIELAFQDDGIGFDLNTVAQVKDGRSCFGLTSMRERTELSGGLFDIRTALGKGTIIVASWPLESPALTP